MEKYLSIFVVGCDFHLQQNSAADLSMLVLEVLEKSETKVEDEILGECLLFLKLINSGDYGTEELKVDILSQFSHL